MTLRELVEWAERTHVSLDTEIRLRFGVSGERRKIVHHTLSRINDQPLVVLEAHRPDRRFAGKD